jgi:hypothetical protein
VLSHLLLEHLFEDGLHALTYSGFYVQLHVVFELAFRGQVPPFSLNPQTSRHYLLADLQEQSAEALGELLFGASDGPSGDPTPVKSARAGRAEDGVAAKTRANTGF